MKRLAPLVLLCFLAAPAFAQTWSAEAVQSLPYLYHEADLKNDVQAMDAVFQKAYLQQFRDYYLAELSRNPVIVSSGLLPLSFENLSQDYTGLYQSLRQDFLNAVADDEDDLLSRLENEERQGFRNNLSSDDMVALKNFYLSNPAFFQLPLSFSNTQRFSEVIEADQKHDLAARLPAAQRLAEAFRPQEASYIIAGDELHAVPPDIIQKNLGNFLSNEYTLAKISDMTAFAESETGASYLQMQDQFFKNRFILLQELYRGNLARAVDNMRARISTLPPPFIVYQKIFFHHHDHRDH